MIELNCTYEESKKILELGYDFGKKFGDVYKKRDCPDKYILVECHKMKAQEFSQVSEKYFDTDVEQFTLERQSIDYEDSLYNNKHIEYFEQGEIFCNPNSEGFTPIIPKAALEACLPKIKASRVWLIGGKIIEENDLKFTKWQGFNLFYTDLDYIQNTDYDSFDSFVTAHLDKFIAKEFNSAYEAFTWCHQHYPEELKEKFDEVMG